MLFFYGLELENLYFTPPKSHIKLFIAGLLITLTILSCSDDPSTGPDLPDPDPDPGTDPVTLCDNLQFQSTSADPLSILSVDGVSNGFGEQPAGWITGGENRIPIALYRVEDSEQAYFTLPIHPSGNLDGGTVEITFVSSDGELECAGFEISINPLEESPGELDRYTSEFKDGLDQLFQQLGVNIDELLNQSMDDMEPHLVPLSVVYKLMTPDHYENNLNAILSGTAPILEGESVSEEQRKLIEALIAKSGLVSLAKTFFEDLSSPVTAGKNNLSAVPAYATNDLLSDNSNKSNVVFQTVTPAELSDLRKMQDYLTGFPNLTSMHPDFPNLFTATQSLIYGIFGHIQTSGAAGDPVMAATMTASLTTIQSALRFILPDLLPGPDVNIELNTNQTEFNEDSEEIGTWNSEFTAESTGHTVNTDLFIMQLPIDLWDDIPVIHEMLTNINQQFRNALDRIGVDLFGIAAGNSLSFQPNTWSVLLDTEREEEEIYFNWNIEHIESWDGNPAFEFYTDPSQNIRFEMGYQPVNAGISELQVRASSEEFVLLYEPEESVELTVSPIEIDLSPGQLTIQIEEAEPEDYEIDVIANVVNADNKQLEWTSNSNKAFFDINDSNGHNVTFYVPEEIGTYFAIAEAITNKGARSDMNPPRRDTLMVRVTDGPAGLMIFPEPGCVTIDDSFQFTAFLDDSEVALQDVTWELDGPGQIDNNGFFTPSDEGFVTIHFEYENPETDEIHTATVEFPVLESCGEFSVESDFFTYFTECVSADGPHDGLGLPFDISTISAAGWTGMGGADMILNMQTDIRDEGEWTRTFRRPSPVAGNSWGVPTFYDHEGDTWVPEDDSIENESEIFTLERIEITLNGETIPLFSGTFELLMYNESEFEREDLYWDEKTESVFKGEFHGIPLVTGLNICE